MAGCDVTSHLLEELVHEAVTVHSDSDLIILFIVLHLSAQTELELVCDGPDTLHLHRDIYHFVNKWGVWLLWVFFNLHFRVKRWTIQLLCTRQ